MAPGPLHPRVASSRKGEGALISQELPQPAPEAGACQLNADAGGDTLKGEAMPSTRRPAAALRVAYSPVQDSFPQGERQPEQTVGQASHRPGFRRRHRGRRERGRQLGCDNGANPPGRGHRRVRGRARRLQGVLREDAGGQRHGVRPGPAPRPALRKLPGRDRRRLHGDAGACRRGRDGDPPGPGLCHPAGRHPDDQGRRPAPHPSGAGCSPAAPRSTLSSPRSPRTRARTRSASSCPASAATARWASRRSRSMAA